MAHLQNFQVALTLTEVIDVVKITFPNKKAQVSFCIYMQSENTSEESSIHLTQGSPGVKLELAGEELSRLQAREVFHRPCQLVLCMMSQSSSTSSAIPQSCILDGSFTITVTFTLPSPFPTCQLAGCALEWKFLNFRLKQLNLISSLCDRGGIILGPTSSLWQML